MMTSKPTFEQLVQIYKALSFEPCGTVGTLVIDVDNKLLLERMLSDPTEYGLSLDSVDLKQVEIGAHVKLNVGNPRVGFCLFARTLEEVLQYPKARISKRKFFVVDNAWASGDDSIPDIVNSYYTVLRFIDLIAEGDAYLDKEKCEIVILDGNKHAIPIVYGEQDIVSSEIQALEQLLSRFTDDTHRKQKLAILISSIANICKSNVGEMTFSKILFQLDHLLSRFDDSYKVFVADFSYEKVMDQVENAKLEELTKIHKVFSDIQNQILSIPIATVIVGTQLKSTQFVDSVFWVNLFILLGVWVFAILMILVINNQSHTLDSISLELDRRKSLISNKYSMLSDQISKVFEPVTERTIYQRTVLKIVQSIVIFGLLGAHVVFALMNDPIANYFSLLGERIEFLWSVIRFFLT